VRILNMAPASVARTSGQTRKSSSISGLAPFARSRDAWLGGSLPVAPSTEPSARREPGAWPAFDFSRIPVSPPAISASRPNRGVQRACAKCEEEHKPLQRLTSESAAPTPLDAAPSPADIAHSPGVPLDTATLRSMEVRLGHRLADVRIHNDDRAHRSAAALRARAYTTGSHIAFAAGQYAPRGREGERVLAHELVHVVQQRASLAGARSGVVPESDPSELEAESIADKVTTGAVSSLTSGGIRAASPGGTHCLAAPGADPISAEALAQFRDLVRSFNAMASSGSAAAPDVALVSTEVAGAEVALANATALAGAQTALVGTAGSAGVVVEEAAVAAGATGVGLPVAIAFAIIGAALLTGAAYVAYRNEDRIRAAWEHAGEAVSRALGAMRRIVGQGRTAPSSRTGPQTQTRTETQAQTETQTQSNPETQTETRVDTSTRRRRRRCRTEPSPEPLPVSWPTEMPLPTLSPRPLVRLDAADREWEGIDRGAEQQRFSREIAVHRQRGVPPPSPCFTDDAEPNTPFDAHHTHPLYLGGEDAHYNLCALETLRHHRGHSRLDNQTPWLEEYTAEGICSPHLKDHPSGQTYEIVGSK
jgi:hypothetical protein